MNPAIIGGGYAGMAAAVSLAARGIPVSVFESAKQLGGRARGVPFNDTRQLSSANNPAPQPSPQPSDGTTSHLTRLTNYASQVIGYPASGRGGERPLPGDTLILDNGQHLLLGCYRQTLRMIELVGGNIEQDFLRMPLQLDLHGHFQLKAPRLPAPLHLLVALLTSQGISLDERISAARFMLTLRSINFTLPSPAGGITNDLAGVVGQPSQMASSSIRGAGGRGGEFEEHALRPSSGSGLPAGTRTASEGNDITVTELLAQHQQDTALVEKLWEPLCIAALNTPIHKASAQVLLNVLRDALNQSRADSDMLLPRIDFTALFPQRAANHIEQHGGRVFTSCSAEELHPHEDCIEISSARGTEKFSHVICAAPPVVAAKLLRPIAGLENIVRQIDSLEHQPIYTVYLQYPATVRLPHPMLGLHRRYSQWLFDKGQIAGQQGLLASVISAEGIHQELSQDELAQKVIAELHEEFGILDQPQWFKVIAEKRATFCCSPNLHRPTQQTALPRLLLAGDYTAGDYPATLEGAVMSGIKCADAITP